MTEVGKTSADLQDDASIRAGKHIADPANFAGGLELRSRLITTVGFTTRTTEVLAVCGVRTVGELLQWTPASLLGTPNIGIKTLVEIENVLDALGASLRQGREYVPETNPERVLDPKGYVHSGTRKARPPAA